VDHDFFSLLAKLTIFGPLGFILSSDAKLYCRMYGSAEYSIEICLNYFQFRTHLFTEYFPVGKNEQLDLWKLTWSGYVQ